MSAVLVYAKESLLPGAPPLEEEGEKQSSGLWHRLVYKIPHSVERFLLFGILVCVDDLLWCLAVLPLNVVTAVPRLLWGTLGLLWGGSLPRSNAFVRWLLLMVSTLLFAWNPVFDLDYVRVYHWTRQEPVLKLYVLFTVWEIFDKLLCGVAPDVLESLRVRRLPVQRAYSRFGFCVVVTTIHAAVILSQCATLNAALNSDTTLFSLLVSQNFAELKISVFKSSSREVLFQTACNDASERVKYLVFLVVVFTRSNGQDCGGVAMRDIMLLFVMEMIVDWVKHFFITRHNAITADVYDDFAYSLARSVLAGSAPRSMGGEASTQWVAHKVGFCAFPVVVVFLRSAAQRVWRNLRHGDVEYIVVAGLLLWGWLLLIKLAVNLLCVGWAARIVEARLDKEPAAAPRSPRMLPSEEVSKPPPPNLELTPELSRTGTRRSLRRKGSHRSLGSGDGPPETVPSSVPVASPPDQFRGVGRYTMSGKQIPFM
eukprot:Hpha_TRINITY_DN22564_c0_g1::TRINITY_DN22564_c0_g1_i1::g.185086::m.185086